MRIKEFTRSQSYALSMCRARDICFSTGDSIVSDRGCRKAKAERMKVAVHFLTEGQFLGRCGSSGPVHGDGGYQVNLDSFKECRYVEVDIPVRLGSFLPPHSHQAFSPPCH